MLRLNHALPLALLLSTSVFAMDKQLVPANQDVFAARVAESATPSPLLSTIVVSQQYEAEKTALTELKKQESELITAKAVKEAALQQSSAQMLAVIASKRKQIEGSASTLTTFTTQLAELKAKAAKDAEERAAKLAQEEADLLKKIAKEEEVKKTYETDLSKLEAQITPPAEEKAYGPEEAPKASWSIFGWLTRK